MATTKRQKPLVKIVFDGVMAVGPGHPEKGTREGPFFGVMALATRRLSDRSRRLRRQAKASGGKKKMQEADLYTPIHVPTIFTLLEPTEDSRQPDQVLQISPFHPKWYLWHPIRERLEFRFDGDGTPGTLEYLRGEQCMAYREKDSPVLLHGIENIPDLRTIWPDRSVLLDGLLSADPDVSDKVATQVLVPYGTVAGAGTLDRGLPLDVVFDPVRKLRSQPSLVPNAAVLVNANRIEIASYSLDSGDRLDSIKLRANRNAEIYVSNGDPSDVELDTKKLAIEIVRRLFREKDRSPRAHQLPIEAESFADSVTKELRFESDDQFFLALELLNHGASTVPVEGLAIRPRAGNVDVDFELYYHLMKNEHLAQDGKGLPVPKRPRKGDKFQGPNCYIAGCETHDRLYFKSQRPKHR